MSKDNKSKASNNSFVKPRKNIGMMIGTIAILILTIVAFIFVPAMTQSGSNSSKLVFGSYGDSDIEYVAGNYFARQIEYINNVYRDSDALSDNVEYKRQLVWQTAFNQAAIQKAMEEKLLQSGVVISEKQIDRAMVDRGPFQVDGEFSEELYRNTSSSAKFELRKQFNEELLREQYLSDVMYGSYRSDNLIDFIANIGSEEKSFNYVVFSSDSIEDSFYTTYASANMEKFSKVSLNRITLFSSEEDAVKLHKRIANNEISFKDAALAESKDSYAAEGGNAGDIYYYELLSDLEDINTANSVFSMSNDEVSEVITTSYGWVIYQMVNSKMLPDLTSPETINDIKVYMSSNEKGLVEDYLISSATEFVDSINDDTTFTRQAISMNLVSGTTDYFPVNFGNNRMIPGSISNASQQNAAFSSAAFDELFLERLFSLQNENDISAPLVLGNNVIVAQLVGTQESTKIPEESMEYYKYQIESEVAGYMQSDLQNLILESEEFENNFVMTYAQIFYSN